MSVIRENLSKNIKYYLDLRGISNKDLAAALGVTAPSVTNWIKGKNSPDIEYIAKICDILNVSINELMGISNSQKSALEIQLLKNFNSLDYLGQNELLTYSNYLLEKQASNNEKKQA